MEHILKPQTLFFMQSAIGNNTSLPEWRMLFKASCQEVFSGGVQGVSHLLKELSDVKGFADKSSSAKIKGLS